MCVCVVCFVCARLCLRVLRKNEVVVERDTRSEECVASAANEEKKVMYDTVAKMVENTNYYNIYFEFWRSSNYL